MCQMKEGYNLQKKPEQDGDNLPDAEFKARFIRMLNDLRENNNRDIETLKWRSKT